MDERLMELMQELGNAINESLSDSSRIERPIAEIRRAGFDVFLILEAKIGFRKMEQESPEVEAKQAPEPTIKGPELHFSSGDETFLKALKIKPGEK